MLRHRNVIWGQHSATTALSWIQHNVYRNRRKLELTSVGSNPRSCLSCIPSLTLNFPEFVSLAPASAYSVDSMRFSFAALAASVGLTLSNGAVEALNVKFPGVNYIPRKGQDWEPTAPSVSRRPRCRRT